MRKKLSQKGRALKKIIVGGLAVSLIVSGIMPAMPTFALSPPVYKNNVFDEVMITRIIPSESYMEITYKRLGVRNDGPPLFFNFQFGEISDFDLHTLDFYRYPGNATIADGHYSQYYHWDEVKDGDIKAITKSMMIRSDFENNTAHRIDYVIMYNLDKQISRMDYSRCVESEVYKAGLATECRMEFKGGGMVQYQPYTADGVRMELSPEEDARLTEATESWRAEPGNWPDYWCDGEQRNTCIEDPEDPSGSGENGGGDDNDNGDGSSDDSNNSGASDTDNSGDSDSNNSGGAENIVAEIAVSTSGQEGSSNTSQAGNTNRGGGVYLGGILGHFGSEVISSIGGGNRGGNANGENNVNGEKKDTNGEESSGANTETDSNQDGNSENTDNNVGVPELGKEEDKAPNWSAIFAILGVAAAGLAGWWFLFFGKYQFKKKKGEKKVEG